MDVTSKKCPLSRQGKGQVDASVGLEPSKNLLLEGTGTSGTVVGLARYATPQRHPRFGAARQGIARSAWTRTSPVRNFPLPRRWKGLANFTIVLGVNKDLFLVKTGQLKYCWHGKYSGTVGQVQSGTARPNASGMARLGLAEEDHSSRRL